MIHYIILGLIEGVTEFLPISSTGHLMLYSHFSGLDLSSNFLKTFEISIQLGAVLAVVFYYFKDLTQIKNIKLLLVGVLPTLAIGFIFKDVVDKLLEYVWIVALNLILGGFIILLAEYIYKKRNTATANDSKIKTVTYKDSLMIGVVQSLAMMPGVSRSGAIIVYGLFKNYEREVIAKYTFLLAVPTMCAATGYSLLKNYKLILLEGGSYVAYISAGFITAFITAMFIVKYALPFIKKYSFVPFGIYRIILGSIILISLY